jgi:peptidoglycan/LPS O-acetylase OafA/YrhL
MKEIKSLTSLRGIAAMAVVLQHFSSTAQKHAANSIPSLVPHGYLAVDFFFVLSGFIMCYTYLHKFEQQGLGAYGPFLLRRAIRLMPLNAFVTLALLLAAWISVSLTGRHAFYAPINGLPDVLANLLLLPGLGIGKLMNGTAWSISTEVLAYAFFPLLIAGAFSRNRVVMVLTGVAAVAGLTYVALQGQRLGLGSEGPFLGSMRCVTEFTMGMLAYRYWAARERSQWLGSDKATGVVLLVTLVVYATRIDLPIALCFPLLVVAVAHNSGRIDAALNTRFVYFLGVISYSLYLVHDMCRPIALDLVRYLHPEPLNTLQALAFAFVASVCVIPFAWATYTWVEHASREWLQKRLSPPRPALR